MPMLGVMRLILLRELGSASGEDAFFSVARTMPFVAAGKRMSAIDSFLGRAAGAFRGEGRTYL